MIRLNVELPAKEAKSYPIIIGENATCKLKEILPPLAGKKALVVTNETIFELYEEVLPKIFEETPVQIEFCILPDGESYKNEKELNKILTCAFEAKMERNDIFIAFGGGVIGDITGFAASIYLRGVKFIQIPTTILAQVDSAVGGKVAINTAYGKNLVGAFYQPKAVISNLDFLKTLPKREVLTGLAEVVKYSFIEKSCGIEFSDFAQFLFKSANGILKLDNNLTTQMVQKCCELKAAVVNQDETEKGLRMILNFGHTIAHAVEKVTNYKLFTHGEAVAIGTKGAFLISAQLGKVSSEYFNFSKELLNSFELNFKIPKEINSTNIANALIYDKKVQNGKVKFVLPVGYGMVEIFDNVEQEVVLEAIKELY